MKQHLVLTTILLLIHNSLQECAIESIRGKPMYACNSIEQLEEQGNSNLLDVTIGTRTGGAQKPPNLQVILLEDGSSGISPKTIQLLKDLSHRFVHNQELLRLPAGLFKDLPIQELHLEQNGIKDIDAGAFSNIANLQKLSIVKNNLNVVKNGIFNNLPVVTLSLSHNRISNLERDCLTGLSKLKRLYLESNRLSDFQPEILLNHPEILEELSLKNNEFNEIDRNTVRGFTGLKLLNVKNNKISKISVYTFENLDNLRVLILSNNLILDLAPDVFPKTGLLNLEKLYLNRNHLSFLTTTTLERLKHIKHISIGGNPWQCPCLDAILLWLDDHHIQRKCDIQYFAGQRPVCVLPEQHPTRCVYMNDEVYHTWYSEVNNKTLDDPDCVL